jgi:phage-related protein
MKKLAKKPAKKIEARFYQSIGGAEPVREWLLSLPQAERRVIGYDIATVEYGWPIGMPVCRAMGGGLFEVRSNLPGNRIARVLFCTARDRLVLLHGFVKKSRATPKGDLDLAKERKKEIEK